MGENEHLAVDTQGNIFKVSADAPTTVIPKEDFINGILQKGATSESGQSFNQPQLEGQSPLSPEHQAILDKAETQKSEVLNEMMHKDSKSLIEGKLVGEKEPIHIIGGNIVRNEDGSIDFDKSDDAVYVRLPDKRVVQTPTRQLDTETPLIETPIGDALANIDMAAQADIAALNQQQAQPVVPQQPIVPQYRVQDQVNYTDANGNAAQGMIDKIGRAHV